MNDTTNSTSLKYLKYFIVAFSIFSFRLNAQSHKDSINTKLQSAAYEIMTSSKTCALISLDEKGAARVRTMDPFPPEKGFTVWFGTNPKSRKVSQIKNDARVTLYYLDKDETGYVTLHGSAQIINDPDKKELWWKEEWSAFYNDKTNGYVLIKVNPVWMEVVSEARGIFGDTLTWQPKKIHLD